MSAIVDCINDGQATDEKWRKTPTGRHLETETESPTGGAKRTSGWSRTVIDGNYRMQQHKSEIADNDAELMKREEESNVKE